MCLQKSLLRGVIIGHVERSAAGHRAHREFIDLAHLTGKATEISFALSDTKGGLATCWHGFQYTWWFGGQRYWGWPVGA